MTSRPPTKKFEEYAYVLDHLPRGYPDDTRPIFKKEPLVQAVGDTYFTLLELVPRKGVRFSPQEAIFIGRDRREKIDHVKRRITFDVLSATARSELPFIVEKLVEKSEQRFVDFFNNARPLTTRMHSLELLPGIGKKLMIYWKNAARRLSRVSKTLPSEPVFGLQTNSLSNASWSS